VAKTATEVALLPSTPQLEPIVRLSIDELFEFATVPGGLTLPGFQLSLQEVRDLDW
jgi:hypothetical protein